MIYDIAIVGAGAAGLAAAIFAAEKARDADATKRIVLIDGARKPGAKILVSGGGRCNVTNQAVTPDDYCGGSPNIIRNVLRSFSEQDTLRWMESLGVELKLEPTGKCFPVSDKARTVLDALMGRLHELKVETRFGFRVAGVIRSTDDRTWTISNAADGTQLQASRVIIACGGRALPKSGSDGAAYAWLENLGHTIVPPVPALAPLILDPCRVGGSPLSLNFAELSGITIDARLTFAADNKPVATFTGSTLFTHFGLSGPAPMNLSRHIARHRLENPNADPGVLHLGIPQFADEKEADAWLLDQSRKRPRAAIAGTLSGVMPERMALCLASAIECERLTDLSRGERLALARLLTASPIAVKGDRGYSFAEATAGGVALNEIDWRTMKSRKAENLFVCGEILDVDGRIGGFNFQWAWASGHLAGMAD